MTRRNFMKSAGALAAGGTLGQMPALALPGNPLKPLFFNISLAEYSLHRALNEGRMTNLEFPVKARKDFGINAVEYVSYFFEGKEKEPSYLSELKNITEGEGVKNVMIMVSKQGDLGHPDQKARLQAIEDHRRWIEAAQYLGCPAIRVNAGGPVAYQHSTPEEAHQAAVEGLAKLSSFAKDEGIRVMVENHGGYSSNGEWLAQVLQAIGSEWCGALPDFGNFCMEKQQGLCLKDYDRYRGTRRLMPFANGVSAKSYDFDEQGYETTIDYQKMLEIVKEAGFDGYIGIEYEGERMSEEAGIRATKQLLEKIGAQLS